LTNGRSFYVRLKVVSAEIVEKQLRFINAAIFYCQFLHALV